MVRSDSEMPCSLNAGFTRNFRYFNSFGSADPTDAGKTYFNSVPDPGTGAFLPPLIRGGKIPGETS
jgi:hypothetical protein